MIRNFLLVIMVAVNTQVMAQASSDAKMQAFISSLMNKMTLEEKIGQLNLVTPGWGVPTGSVVSQGVEDNIRKGRVGGLFGIYGSGKVR